ncbi:hypothetical protein SODG_005027 [Sodalis praecaptivus]
MQDRRTYSKWYYFGSYASRYTGFLEVKLKTIKWRVTEDEYKNISNVIKSHGARSVHQFFKDISLAILSKEEVGSVSNNINDIDYLFINCNSM